MERLWTTGEVAQCLGIAEAEVEPLVQRGLLTGYKLGGEFLRFRPAQVEALKGTLAVQRADPSPTVEAPQGWWSRLRDALYFYDFYLLSAGLLAVLIVYLVIGS